MESSTAEAAETISVASVVEDVLLKQQGKRLDDLDLASRMAHDAAERRYKAARWLRKMVGFVGAKDLPEEPSEEEFRLGLRSGMILCNVLNKVEPGAVPKVVETPGDSVVVPDGAALSAYQYFENVRNFLVALQEIGLPTFEASDLAQGGKSARVVHCIMALKSYNEWKQMGGHGSWKYAANTKPASSGKYFIRKNSELFMNSFSRNQSTCDAFPEAFFGEQHSTGNLPVKSAETTTSHSLNMLVRDVLSDRKPEEVPLLVESMLNKVMEEFERRIASQNELVKTTMKDLTEGNKSFSKSKVSMELSSSSGGMKMEIEENKYTNSTEKDFHLNGLNKEMSRERLQRQCEIFDQQQRDIKELKHTLHITKANVEFFKMQHSEELNNLGKHLRVLSNAASGYHKVLEENRKLYNQVQDLKGNIRVYCRVRPFLPGESSSTSTVGRIDDGSITILTPVKYVKEGCKSFRFNKVFGPSATQEEVFSDTRPLIRSILDGYNVCIFAYGQTGSGKTHTMSGPKELNEQSRGVNYRALGDLFYISEERRDTFSYEISVQMIEIYNEQVRDLLANDGLSRRLEIRNSSQNGVNVPDANLVPVSSTSEVIELMNIGQRNRAMSATAMNDRSSRSHSCLTIHVRGRDLTSGTILQGCMHLVDLAGSERVDKSGVRGDQLKEAQHINKSLSALGDVISALAQKNSHVPYRNSKLTQLLQDSLGGQAKTLMFVHVSPEADALGETISTLKFAERVASVELGAARLNKESGEIKELKGQIANLKAALARKDGETGHLSSTMSSPDTYRMKSGDVGSIKNQERPAPLKKSSSFDIQQLLADTDSVWSGSLPRKDYGNAGDKEVGTGEWVDKVAVNEHEVVIGDDDSLRDWEADSASMPDFFYQRYLPDVRFYSDQQCNRSVAATDDSDDLEFATSDSLEVDLLWQCNIPKLTNTVNGGRSKIKKPQSKPLKSSDIRTPSQPRIPSPARKISNGLSQTPNRNARRVQSSAKVGK